MSKRSAEVGASAVPDADADSSDASEKSTPTKNAKKSKIDPSTLRPASDLSPFVICRQYDKCKTFAATIQHFNRKGYNLYNAAIARALQSERGRKAKEFEESLLSKAARDLKKKQEKQQMIDTTAQGGRKPLLDRESMELLHKAAGRERDRVALIRPNRTDCEFLIDIVHWKQCKRISGETTKYFMHENPNIQL
jgi:hypothetical protein